MTRLPGLTRFISVLLTGLLLTFFRSAGQNPSYEEQVRKYVETYKDIAIREMMIYRIPASITLAQGVFESNAGMSRLATEANNHFGIKCHKEWTGKTFIQDDETKNECFRKYDQAEESFRDHSSFLTTRDRYKPLFSLDITDYKGWARGLKAAGYATNPKYPEKLITTIENFQLYRYDIVDYTRYFGDSVQPSADSIKKPTDGKKYDTFAVGPGGRMVYINNGLQFVILAKGDNAARLAAAFSVSERKILKWNDLKKGQSLAAGQKVYLENKKQKAAVSFHVVREKETMYTISQQYGVQLKCLYKKNSMKPGQVPAPGQKLRLR